MFAIMEEKNTVAIKLLTNSGADIIGITDEVQTLLRTVERNSNKSKFKRTRKYCI